MKVLMMTDEQTKIEIDTLSKELPGFDTRNALERMGGNPSVYISFISKFFDVYNDGCRKLSELLSNNNLTEAHRLVHTLKSLAGNLGAVELYESSVNLEVNMQRGKVMPSNDEVESFNEKLGIVLGELNTFLAAREGMN